MNTTSSMPEAEPVPPPRGALSLYQEDGGEDFPVLKAFQQYIDSEQAKARKRMVSLSVFYGFLMAIVIAVFVLMLLKISDRNQTLNDRLVEYAMKDRERTALPAPVVVQSPQPPADNSALLALTEKLADMQKQLAASQAQAAKAAEEAKAAAARQVRGPSPEEQEIARLKAQLQSAKDEAAAEKAKKREAELEAYRRQHYPELYAPRQPTRPASTVQRPTHPVTKPKEGDLDEDELDDESAISYFDDDEEDDVVLPKRSVKQSQKTSVTKKPLQAVQPKTPQAPIKVQTTSGGWQIPED